MEGVVLGESVLVQGKTPCHRAGEETLTLRPITPMQAIEGIAVAMVYLVALGGWQVGSVGWLCGLASWLAGICLWLKVRSTYATYPGGEIPPWPADDPWKACVWP